MGDTTFLYFLYILGTYPSPESDNQSGYIVFEEHSNAASYTGPDPFVSLSYRYTYFGNNTGLFLPGAP